ncbi:MAG TPA: M24 family metallopeptidase, partial [Planctomycetota bacterium]|nr:M24 family metallopeptidase [Planctomycetota bacterium]
AWLTDGADVHVDGSSSTGVGSLLWTPQKRIVLTTNIEARRLADEEFGRDWEVESHPWWEKTPPRKGRFATDFPEDPFADLRSPLTPLELRRIRDLGELATASLHSLLTRLPFRGESEHQVAGALSSSLRCLGVQVPVLLVASDGRIARYRHPVPTTKKIDRLLMVAACPRRHGLTVALTRLVYYGKRLPPALRRKHDAVCRVDAALHAATAPGQRWCDILKVGIQVYRETGYADEWKLHHQGGPVGYEGREFKATPTERRQVVEAQAVGWNPSITGTKSEDTILSSGEPLTGPREWPTCGTRPDILCRA